MSRADIESATSLAELISKSWPVLIALPAMCGFSLAQFSDAPVASAERAFYIRLFVFGACSTFSVIFMVAVYSVREVFPVLTVRKGLPLVVSVPVGIIITLIVVELFWLELKSFSELVRATAVLLKQSPIPQ